MATQVLKIVVQVVDKATVGLKKVEKTTKNINKNLKRTNRNAFRFLGIGLGMLFTGMALKRFFGGFLRAAFNTFKMVIDAESEAFQKTQQLSAAWEFLKFSIIDALLSSDIILSLIDNVIRLLDLFGQLPEETRAKIGKMAIVGFLAATAMMFLGQALLFMIGLSMALGWSLGTLIVSLFLLVFAWAVLKSDLTAMEKKLLLVGTAFGILGVAIWKIAGLSAFAIFIPILLIAALILLVGLLSIKFGGVANAFKAMGVTLIMGLAVLADAWFDFMIFPLILAAKGIVAVIEALGGVAPAALKAFSEEGFDIKGKAAKALIKFQPDVVEKKPIGSIFEGVGEDMLSGFSDFSEKMLEKMNEQIEELVEKQNEKMDEMMDKQSEDMGEYIGEQTTKLDETMNKMNETMDNIADILQTDVLVIPTTQT